jgi:MYND finger
MQGGDFACGHMSRLVCEIALIIYKDHGIHGYCPIPEAYFWRQQALEVKRRDGEPITEEDCQHDDESQRNCIWCDKGVNVTLRRCAQCSVFSYCSEACQKAHWKQGHKADCNRVKELKELIREW